MIQPRHSVRARVTAWYALTLFSAFVLAVMGLRLALVETLHENFDKSLKLSGGLVTSFFRYELAEYRTVNSTVEHLAAHQLMFTGRHVQFLPPPGVHLSELAARPPRPLLQPPLRTIELPLDPALAPGWRVRIIASEADDVALLRRMDFWFGGIILLSVVVASIGGWWLSGRALRPVREMATAAERITAERSSERLPVGPEVDEFARLGTRFNALLDRLDGALSQQRRFLADAAHELRTPVARMRGTVELALDPRVKGGDTAVALNQLRDELTDVSGMLDELLHLARADAGGQDVLLAPGYLDDVVVGALGAWTAFAHRKGVALELPIVEETPVALDAILIRRLLGVLVDNAIRYTPAGGRVSVAVRQDKDVAVLEVEDSGIGMAAADRERAFERFYRGAEGRRLAPDGSGLGLAIAAWVAARHGATISIDAAHPAGTRVTVRFPLTSASPAVQQVAGSDRANTARSAEAANESRGVGHIG